MSTLRLFLERPCEIEVNFVFLSSFFNLFFSLFSCMLANDLSIKIFICVYEVIVINLCHS